MFRSIRGAFSEIPRACFKKCAKQGSGTQINMNIEDANYRPDRSKSSDGASANKQKLSKAVSLNDRAGDPERFWQRDRDHPYH